MKKGLLGTTALIASGSLFAAQAEARVDLQLRGYMQQWFGYAKQDDDLGPKNGPQRNDFTGTNTFSDTEVHFLGSTTLDNGLTFGVNIQLEGNTNSDQIDESYLFVASSFGRVEIGSENTAFYKMQFAAPAVGLGLNTGDQNGFANSSSGINGSQGFVRGPFASTFVEINRVNNARVVSYYTPSFSGFKFGASYRPTTSGDAMGPVDRESGSDTLTDIVSFRSNYVESFDDFEVALAAGWGTGVLHQNGADDPSAWSHGERDGVRNPQAFSYGPLEAEQNRVHLSGAYSLGPGVKMVGTLGLSEIEDKSGLGTDNTA